MFIKFCSFKRNLWYLSFLVYKFENRKNTVLINILFLVYEKSYLPNSGCLTDNDCPAFSKCNDTNQCVCYLDYELSNGLCGNR